MYSYINGYAPDRCLITKSILVTGSGGSAGNNVCWSLRACPDGRQVTLTGTDTDRTSLELNRWIDNAYVIPSAGSSNYLPALNKIIGLKMVEGIFPQPDQEVKAISQVKDRIEAKTFLPDTATVSACLDKYEALTRWHRIGLRRQPLVLERSRLTGKNLGEHLQQLEFPCWTRAREGAGGLMSCLAKDWRSLAHWVQFHWEQGIEVDFTVEEYLPGRDFCFMSIWNDGRLVTSMVRERLSWIGNRTIGVGGTSRLNRVVHSEQANRMSIRAIEAIAKRPHGIFCVDLKGDERNEPRPTEINCRFTTNVHYLTLAAIKFARPEWNFAWLAARLMLEEPIPSCRDFDALPDNLSFTKNIDMGYTVVEDEEWRAVPIG